MTYEIELACNHRDVDDYAAWLRANGHKVRIAEPGFATRINIDDEYEACDAIAGLWDDYRDQPPRDENGWLMSRASMRGRL